MNIKGYFKQFFRDPCYDHRKIINSTDLIKTAKMMGYTYKEIGKICDVSTTMISHWGSDTKPERPTYKQLEPMFEHCGRGRFIYDLEPLPPSAIEYHKHSENISMGILTFVMLGFFWYIMIKPCSDNWSQCQKLPWYKMGTYEANNFGEVLKEFKEWKKLPQDVRHEALIRGKEILETSKEI